MKKRKKWADEFYILVFGGFSERSNWGRARSAVDRRKHEHPAPAHPSPIHHTPLFSLQGRLGLDHSPVSPLHGSLHTLRGGLHAQQGRRRCSSTEPHVNQAGQHHGRKLAGSRPAVRHRHDRRYHVHRRHPYQLPDYVPTQRRGGHQPDEDCVQLRQVLVSHWRRGSHSLRSLPIRNRKQWRKHRSFLLPVVMWRGDYVFIVTQVWRAYK